MSRVPEDYDKLCDQAYHDYSKAILSWDPPCGGVGKVYVAGPMRGIRYFNYPAFSGAKDALEEAGFKVLMADLTEEPNEEGHTDTPLKKFMQHDLPLLCQADCVFVLPGWQNSHGARIETHLAFQLDIPVYDIMTGRDIVEQAKEKVEAESCKHLDNHFDRSICACGSMHTYCNDCGNVLDACPYEKQDHLPVHDTVDSRWADAHPDTAKFIDECQNMIDLHLKKSQDYGSDADPFANVASSADFGMPAWVGCMVRANDKMHRIQKAAQGHALRNESLEDSLRDLAAYAVIGLVLLKREEERRD